MYSGMWPERCFATNEPLDCKGFRVPGQAMYDDNVRFKLCELRGDWKHHQQVWGLVKAAFTSNNICHVCQASRRDEAVSMLQFTEEPRWASTVRSHATFLNEIMGEPACSLIYIKGFHYGLIKWCAMHSVQLGVGLFLNGGCFYELLKINWFPGDNVACRFRSAYEKFKLFLRSNNIYDCSQPCFKPWMLVSNSEESCTLRSKVSGFI